MGLNLQTQQYSSTTQMTLKQRTDYKQKTDHTGLVSKILVSTQTSCTKEQWMKFVTTLYEKVVILTII